MNMANAHDHESGNWPSTADASNRSPSACIASAAQLSRSTSSSVTARSEHSPKPPDLDIKESSSGLRGLRWLADSGKFLVEAPPPSVAASAGSTAPLAPRPPTPPGSPRGILGTCSPPSILHLPPPPALPPAAASVPSLPSTPAAKRAPSPAPLFASTGNRPAAAHRLGGQSGHRAAVHPRRPGDQRERGNASFHRPASEVMPNQRQDFLSWLRETEGPQTPFPPRAPPLPASVHTEQDALAKAAACLGVAPHEATQDL